MLFQPDHDSSLIQPYPKTIQELLSNLKSSESWTPARLCKLLKNSDISSEDLLPWTNFSHDVTESYGRKMIYKDDHFEVMVMSWDPGDYSAIHDHGHTQWGAVKVFGEAEHAVFRIEDNMLKTLSRSMLSFGKVIGVSHSLIHQMGNPSPSSSFISLHVYGTNTAREEITGEARLYNLLDGTIERINGGVFYNLKSEDIIRKEKGFLGDFPTALRNRIEWARRRKKVLEQQDDLVDKKMRGLISSILNHADKPSLLTYLNNITDEEGFITDTLAWRKLIQELKVASLFISNLKSTLYQEDQFAQYAEMYDGIVGIPCLDGFMSKYLNQFVQNYCPDISKMNLLSIGCGTGLVEAYIMKNFGMPYDRLSGFDYSNSMVEVAKRRMNAHYGELLTYQPDSKTADITFSGLNVLQYIPAELFESAIAKVASLTKEGGWFVGDFITPDHIRNYPNFIESDDGTYLSLRRAEIIERDGKMYQQSAIINLAFHDNHVEINDAGKHLRHLVPIHRVRKTFESYFGLKVHLYDAYSLSEIISDADSCPSTRYVVIAQKRR